MKALVTGATGFVGRPLVADLAAHGIATRRALRSPADGADDAVVGDIGPTTHWSHALAGIDAVVHLAARAHVLREEVQDPEPLFMAVNAEGTRRLAEAARDAGVRHFIFISSIGVHGMSSEQALHAGSPLQPVTPYGRSKLAAEQALEQIAASSTMRVTVLRPPLIHGPGAPGNLQRLMGAVRRGLPLPLGGVHNRRSLLGVQNLCSMIRSCLASTGSGIERYTVSDGEEISTAELIRLMAQGMQRKPRLLPVPPALLRLAGSMLGRRQQIEQLCGSLVVDNTQFSQRHGWRPEVRPHEGIVQMARAFNNA